MMPLRNQIQRWLKHPIVWRFTGFASAVVGLLSYALSSSFNSLFGEWKLWKTLLYSVLSFIICTAVLLAKTCQHSSSFRFKAYTAFLVLAITSFYTSFFDKHANGKPDVYSLVSCASFAVMSLSLSRQTHFGCEVDLLYFFLGALIVQLVKIEWSLGIVGMGFSYSLIILRSCLNAEPQANGYTALQPQPQVGIQVCSLHVSNCLGELKKKNPSVISLVYRYRNRVLHKFFGPDHNLFIDALPSEIIDNLNEAMKFAVAAGFEEECCRLYSSCRREFLLECLSELNMQEFFNNEYQNADLTIERIHSWSLASNLAFKLLFPNERRLCDRVFSGLSSVRDLTFVQICMEHTICLLNFPRTFKFKIGMPTIRSELVQLMMKLNGIIFEMKSLFPNQEAVSLLNEVTTSCRILGEAIRDVFKDMENLIRCDARSPNVPGGNYPIVEDVVNCLHEIIKLKPMIERIWKIYPMVSNIGGTCSPSFFDQISWIMELLEKHLEAKSKNYTEPGLCNVSMMNNIMYMKRSIEELSFRPWIISDDNDAYLRLGSSFRDEQIRNLTAKVQQNLDDYRRSSWGEVLGLLSLDTERELVARGSRRVAELMKEKLQLFNIQFEQVCSIQSKWFAIDSEMRMEIIKAVEDMLIPAYGHFVGTFQNVLGKHAEQYIQFGIFDLKARLNNTFLGGDEID